MLSKIATTAYALVSPCVLLPVHGNTFEFYNFIGESFLNSNKDTTDEASGLDIAPDRSHLVSVSDAGKIFFLNLDDYNSGHCVVDLANDVGGRTDFEGVAIDPNIWRTDNMTAYVLYEGSSSSEPYLFKIHYTFDPDEPPAQRCSADVVESTGLFGAIPCPPGGNGLEGLTLKTPSSASTPAVFVTPMQDTSNLYEITSDGLPGNSSQLNCYDGGLGVNDISASGYDTANGYIWSFFGTEHKIAVIDPSSHCTLGTYDIPDNQDMPSNWDKEGLAFDFDNDHMYLCVDNGGGDASFVAIYNFTYPTNLNPNTFCCGDGICSGTEDATSCPEDCPHCGDGVCGVDGSGDDEDCETCPQDCNSKTNGNPDRQYCCNATSSDGCTGPGCDVNGNACVSPVTAQSCSGFNVCDGSSTGPSTTCKQSGEDGCNAGTDCCSGKCKGNGICH